jgi:hypothetical protein
MRRASSCCEPEAAQDSAKDHCNGNCPTVFQESWGPETTVQFGEVLHCKVEKHSAGSGDALRSLSARSSGISGHVELRLGSALVNGKAIGGFF